MFLFSILCVTEGDGREGYAQLGPYDAIHVGAASPELPTKLIEQLKPGGRLVVPIGGQNQRQSLEVVCFSLIFSLSYISPILILIDINKHILQALVSG